MLLRRFYVQENEKAPVPKAKKSRELKHEFLPLDYSKYISSEDEFVRIYGQDQLHIYYQSLKGELLRIGANVDDDDDDDNEDESEISEEFDLHPKKRKMSIEVKGVTYAVKI